MLQENDPSKEAPKKKAAPTEEKKKEAKPAPKKQDSSFTCNSNLMYRRVFDFPFLPSSFCRSFFRFPVQEPNLTDEAWDCQFIEGWMDEESDLIDWLVLIVYDCSSILSYDVGWCWHVLAANSEFLVCVMRLVSGGDPDSASQIWGADMHRHGIWKDVNCFQIRWFSIQKGSGPPREKTTLERTVSCFGPQLTGTSRRKKTSWKMSHAIRWHSSDPWPKWVTNN